MFSHLPSEISFKGWESCQHRQEFAKMQSLPKRWVICFSFVFVALFKMPDVYPCAYSFRRDTCFWTRSIRGCGKLLRGFHVALVEGKKEQERCREMQRRGKRVQEFLLCCLGDGGFSLPLSQWHRLRENKPQRGKAACLKSEFTSIIPRLLFPSSIAYLHSAAGTV